MKLLENQNIILGVTSSIASFKAVALASKLTQQGALVDVIMTEHATRLVSPASFEGVTHRKCFVDVMADTEDLSALHVSIAARAKLAVIAPCSANMIGKIAHGIADDKLSTTMLAVRCPVLIAPAMNVNMFENVAVQDNLEILRRRGMIVMEPALGNLACGYSGKGRMPEPEVLLEEITRIIGMPKYFEGKHVLVTAGATREPIDAVRYISNPSTGKMGYACARAALMAGARVTLVTGPTSLSPVLGANMIHVTTAHEMAQAVFEAAQDADIIIMSAAVSDFTPKYQEKHKIHKTDASLCIELKPTVDILQTLGLQKRPNQYLCGFCMETENLVERAKYKLVSKHLDLVVANSLNEPGCGFAGDTNGVTLVSQGEERRLTIADKLDIAMQIVEYIHQGIGNKESGK